VLSCSLSTVEARQFGLLTPQTRAARDPPTSAPMSGRIVPSDTGAFLVAFLVRRLIRASEGSLRPNARRRVTRYAPCYVSQTGVQDPCATWGPSDRAVPGGQEVAGSNPASPTERTLALAGVLLVAPLWTVGSVRGFLRCFLVDCSLLHSDPGHIRCPGHSALRPGIPTPEWESPVGPPIGAVVCGC
jgi:hypothetical protein